MGEINSRQQILRSSAIIGGASVVNIIIGLLRVKIAALLLGPAGIGLISLLQSMLATASTIIALGFGNVGTRQISEAAGRDDTVAMVVARRALFWGTLGLAVVGGGIFWALRDVISSQMLGDSTLSVQVSWLTLGVILSVGAGSQNALLNGMRKIGDIARISILSALFSTLTGVGALLIWGEAGLLIYVLSAPFASFLFGYFFINRLPKLPAERTSLPRLIEQWRTMIRLGSAFMIAGLAVTAGQFAVRALIQRELGPEALGHFSAAWMISMTYIGFVLQAMGTDYYPRLTRVINNHSEVNRLANEQTEVALLLAGPVFLAILGLAPWIIELLYSKEFTEAASILKWQILGDLLKVASWPLGFIILSAGAGRTFMLSEIFAISIFVVITWLGLPLLGIEATGIAFLLMYTVYLPLVYVLARKRTGFRWSKKIPIYISLLTLASITTILISNHSSVIGGVVGILFSAITSSYAFKKLSLKKELDKALRKILGESQSNLKSEHPK